MDEFFMRTFLIRVAALIIAFCAPSMAQAQSVTYDFSVISPNNTDVVFSGYVVKGTQISGSTGSFDSLYVTGYRDSSGNWVDLGSSGLQISGASSTYTETSTAGVYYISSLNGVFDTGSGFYRIGGTMPSMNSAVYDFGFSVDSTFTAKEQEAVANNYKINNLVYATMFFNSGGAAVLSDGTLATNNNAATTFTATALSAPEVDGSKLPIAGFTLGTFMLWMFARRRREQQDSVGSLSFA